MSEYCTNYLFAFGLINSVMRKCMSNWSLQEFSSYRDMFYTPQMEAAVMTILDRRLIELFFLFSNEFASKGITIEAFTDISEAMKLDFTTDPFNAKELIWFCIVLAYYSAVASKRGVLNAPLRATYVIMEYLEHYRKTGEFNDDIWPEVEQAAITIAQDP